MVNLLILFSLGIGTLYFLFRKERSLVGPHWPFAVASWGLSFCAVALILVGG